MRHWLRGAKVNLPIEIVILEMAQEWGMVPWQVEAECSQRWFEWWTMYKGEQGKEQERLMKRRSRSGR